MTSEIMAVIVIFIGLGVIALGIAVLVSKIRKNAVCTEEVTAVLIHYEEQSAGPSGDRRGDSSSTYYYFPVFRYDANSEEKIVQSSSGRNSKRWKEGAHVTIRYNPVQPASLVIVGDKNHLISFIGLEILGITALVCGILAALGIIEFNLKLM